MDQQTLLKIQKYFIKHVQPAEAQSLLRNYRTCVGNQVDEQALVEQMQAHNEAHLVVVSDQQGYKYVLSQYGRHGEEYLDQVHQRIISVDHVGQVITAWKNLEQECSDAPVLRLDHQLRDYLQHYYSDTAHHFLMRHPDGSICILISANYHSPHNSTGGEWISQWDFINGRLEGKISLRAHCFEEGHIQMECIKGAELETEEGKLVEAIMKKEEEAQHALEEYYEQLREERFKRLRRTMPSKQSKKWQSCSRRSTGKYRAGNYQAKSDWLQIIIRMSNQVKTQQDEYEVYQRIKLLGEGSFGKAYLVRSTIDNQKYVVKQMDLSNMSKQEELESIKEARILEALQHPNIIKFKEMYKTKKGKLCIVMDFADGGDLAKILRDQKGIYFSESQILDWFTQICLAMKHVHDRKILHRDLKSQNIFITKANIIKLGDFGIARELAHTHQKVKTMVGTPYYLSPEIIQNKPYSFKSDVWSMGIILYELSMLRPPFNGESIHSLAVKIVDGKYQPISSQYSKDLRHLINLCLSQDPNRRPSIAQILKMPLIRNRIKTFLSESVINYEFSHTILHNRNILKEQKEQKDKEYEQHQKDLIKKKQREREAQREQLRLQQQKPVGNYAQQNRHQGYANRPQNNLYTPQAKQPQSRVVPNNQNNLIKRQISQPEFINNNQLNDKLQKQKEQLDVQRKRMLNDKKQGKKEDDYEIQWIGNQKQQQPNGPVYNNFVQPAQPYQPPFFNAPPAQVNPFNNGIYLNKEEQDQIVESLHNTGSVELKMGEVDEQLLKQEEEELRVYSQRQIDQKIWQNNQNMDKNDEYNMMFEQMYYIIGDDKDNNKEDERKDSQNDSLDQLLKESQKHWMEDEQQAREPREIDYKAEMIELRANVHINKPVAAFAPMDLTKNDSQNIRSLAAQLLGTEVLDQVLREARQNLNAMATTPFAVLDSLETKYKSLVPNKGLVYTLLTLELAQ